MDHAFFRTLTVGMSAAALLAACGGGGSGDGEAPAPDPLDGPTADAGADVGGFIVYLKSLVARPDEVREPAALGDFTPPRDDAADTEPLD